MTTFTQRMLLGKNTSTDNAQFCVQVLCSAHRILKWKVSMESSVLNYSDKVAQAIEKCANAAADIIMCSQHPRSFQLMKHLVREIDRCDLALRFNCARARDLIETADMCTMNAPEFKQNLFQVIENMRHPAMPDINFILKAIGENAPNKRMRAPHPCRK